MQESTYCVCDPWMKHATEQNVYHWHVRTITHNAHNRTQRKCHFFFLRFADCASQYNLSKGLAWHTNSLFYNKFITVLYMFRATSCSSSGGQIVLIQHLVLSLSVGDRPVHRLRQNSLNLCTGRSPTDSDETRCCINTIWHPDDKHDVARNRQRTVINLL
jgi:hypothetical protein